MILVDTEWCNTAYLVWIINKDRYITIKEITEPPNFTLAMKFTDALNYPVTHPTFFLPSIWSKVTENPIHKNISEKLNKIFLPIKK